MCLVTFDWAENDAVEKFKKFDESRTLSWGIIELTDKCNFNCKWCYANSSRKNNNFISKENMKKMVPFLAEAGIKQVTCSGGEPLLYPYIKEFIKELTDHGIITHMITNGYLLTKNLAMELKKLGLTQVHMNIDSLDPKKHDRIRRMPGSFDKTIHAFKNAMNAGLICASQTVLTKYNEDEILDIFKFARSMNIERCRVWDVMPAGRCAGGNSHLRPTDYLATLRMLTSFACETGAKNIESGDPLFPGDYKTDISITGGYCITIAGLVLVVSPAGDVYFCCAKREKMYNLFEVMEKQIPLRYFHKRRIEGYKRYKSSVYKLPEKCRGCNLLKECKAGCIVRRKYSSDDADYWCRYSPSSS